MLMLLASFRYVNLSIMFVRNNEFVVSFVDLRPINSFFFFNSITFTFFQRSVVCIVDFGQSSIVGILVSQPAFQNQFEMLENIFWICINLNSVDFATSNKESQFFSLCHMIDGDNRLLMQRRVHGIKYILACWRGK